MYPLHFFHRKHVILDIRQPIARIIFSAALILMSPLVLSGQTVLNPDPSIDACNVTWTTPGPTSAESMPVGNGDIGLNVWVESNGDLNFYIGKTDAWGSGTSDNNGILKLGRVKVSLSPRPSVTPFTQVLRLRNGEIFIQQNTTTFRVWVDANNPVIRVEVASPTAVTVTALINNWRPASASDVTLTGQSGRIGWYHQNPASDDPHVANRIFGAMITGPGMTTTNNTTLTSSAPVTSKVISIYPLTTTSATPAQWQTQLNSAITSIGALNLETTRTAHQAWWQNFWHRSWIFVRGNATATAVTKGYVLQRFVTACAGRGAYPIKFNGSIFTVDNPAHAQGDGTTIAVDADFRNWGGQYWFQNTRAIYWPRLMAGDFDIMTPLFNMYAAMLPANSAQVTGYYGHGGAYFAETAPFWGGLQYAGPDATPGYTVHYFTPILELSMMMLDYYEYTGDATFAQQKLMPVMTAGLQFFNEHFPRDAQGKLLLNPDNAIEMWWGVNNPAPDIAALQSVLQRAIALPSSLVSSTTRNAWIAFQQQLPPLPTGTSAEGLPVLLPYTGPQTATVRNSENPELYSVFPFRLYGLAQGNYNLALNTFNARRNTWPGSWSQDGIQAAMLGLADVAQAHVSYNLTHTDPRMKFQAFWERGDYTPDQDTGECGVNTLQQMVMYAHGKVILLPAAWPAGWDCDFKLNAPLQTTVQGSIIGGKVTNLVVTPSSRAADVIDMSNFSSNYLGGYSILYQQDTIAALKGTTAGGTNVLAASGPDYASSEGPSNVLDANANTKHFNKAQSGSNPPGVNTGFVVTPQLGSSVATGIRFATANDVPGRDPLRITLEGSNAANATNAGAGGFTLIYSGPAGLQPNQDRKTWGYFATFPNTTAYKTYRCLITNTAGGASADGVQCSEFEVLGTLVNPLPGSNVLSSTDVVASLKQTVQGGTNTLAVSGTDYSSGESAVTVKDGSLNSKYYNTSQLGMNTGFVITPSAGSQVVNGFRMATAYDVPGRDPVSITIEGSNDLNAGQAGGGGFTLLYSGPSGLQQGLARTTWGPVINFWNTAAYKTYRVLVTGIADPNSGGAQYSEFHLNGVAPSTTPLSRTGWTASASVNAGGWAAPSNALDGNLNTRWGTGVSQANGQWFQVDMGSSQNFNQITMDASVDSGDFPRGYQINVSADGVNWGSPVATGTGSSAVINVTFPAVTARYIRVTQTLSGATGNWWSIDEFNVYH